MQKQLNVHTDRNLT